MKRSGPPGHGPAAAPTILVADGDRLARDFLRDLLRSAGYRVRTAGTGPEALASVHRHPPDLLLLDVRLPQIHGLAVCEQVRQTANGHHVPIILVTDPGSKAEMVKGFEAGADDFLWKPVDQAELMARVKGHLRVKGYRDELEREKTDLANVLEISKAATSALSAQAIFRIIVERTARLVDATRCSLIVIRHQGENGQVVASSQHESPPDFLLDLTLYPEVRHALQTRAPVLVQDVDTDPLMAAVREKIRPLGFRSFLVLPISLRDNVVGTLVLTTVRAGRPFSERNLRTCQLIADIAANALQNAHVFESLELDQVNLQRRALEDERLGVFHWHVFGRRLEEELARAYRYKQPVACLAIEVEGRPGVEVDPEGVLRDVARLIRENIRKSDVMGRHLSGRLLLMLPITAEEGARIKSQRLRALVQSHALGGAPAGQITINVGISAGVPEAPAGMERLVDSALAALVEAEGQAPEHVALCPFA